MHGYYTSQLVMEVPCDCGSPNKILLESKKSAASFFCAKCKVNHAVTWRIYGRIIDWLDERSDGTATRERRLLRKYNIRVRCCRAVPIWTNESIPFTGGDCRRCGKRYMCEWRPAKNLFHIILIDKEGEVVPVHGPKGPPTLLTRVVFSTGAKGVTEPVRK